MLDWLEAIRARSRSLNLDSWWKQDSPARHLSAQLRPVRDPNIS